jgi:hypothetical protein
VAFFDSISVLSILLGVVCAPFAIIGWLTLRGSDRNRFLEISFVAFIVFSIMGLLSAGISTFIGQNRVGEFLDSASPACAVSVDGHIVPDSANVLAALREAGDLPAHHSSPTRTFEVVVSCPPRQLTLWVARDSSDPREYWVFFPSPSRLAYRAALKTDIGHVKTSAFDGYGT